MKTVSKKMSELFPTEKNVRKHPETQIKELQRSYKMHGQYRPLVVTAEGEILIGNGLYTALLGLGVEEVDCVVLPKDTSDSAKRKLMLSDNKIFELGANDVGNIDDILASMKDFDIPGFDEQTLNELYAEAQPALEAINDMFVIPNEKKEAIERVSEQRESDTPAEVSTPANGPASVPERAVRDQPVTEHTDSYITCPHCGMKIWES